MSAPATAEAVRLTCPHCWAVREIDITKICTSTSFFCSSDCKQRDAAWEAWIRKTNRLAISGDIAKPIVLGPQLPPGGKGLTESVARFTVTDPAQLVLTDAA